MKMKRYTPVMKPILNVLGIQIGLVYQMAMTDQETGMVEIIGYCESEINNALHVHLTPQDASDCFRRFCKEKMNNMYLGDSKVLDSDYGTTIDMTRPTY